MRTSARSWAASVLIFATSVVSAQASAPPETMQLTAAEVRKVDMETKKITLRHAEIKNLDMPQMTMVFGVTDPALLEKVKVGNKVRFTAQRLNGVYTVTSIELAK